MAERPWDVLSEADKAEFWALLALKYTPGIGPRTIVRLLKYFGSAFSALEQKNDWVLAKVSADKARLVASEVWRSLALIEWKNAQLCHSRILLWSHDLYPHTLRSLVDAPAILYCRGDISLLSAPCVAIVGSRKCSSEGVKVAGDIARNLSKAGISIVSGMAQGIDRVAHLAALDQVGKSVGVLGTGIDVVYPQHNRDIYEKLGEQGLLLSEFAPKTEPIATNFPIRNRLVSGLCLGVLVVEGTLHSGSLITARLALEQNREVYAIPGATTADISRGCQELIRQGAKAVFNSEDILYDLATLLQEFPQKTDVCPLAVQKQTDFKKDALENSASFLKKNQKITIENKKNTDITYENDCVAVQDKNIEEFFLEELSLEEQGQVQKILTLLHSKGECHIDTLCQELNLPVAQVTTLLIEMELARLVKKIPGARYTALCAHVITS